MPTVLLPVLPFLTWTMLKFNGASPSPISEDDAGPAVGGIHDDEANTLRFSVHAFRLSSSHSPFATLQTSKSSHSSCDATCVALHHMSKHQSKNSVSDFPLRVPLKSARPSTFVTQKNAATAFHHRH